MKTGIKGLTAVITGGGSGVGFEIARHLNCMGCNVILCGRNRERLEKACALLLENTNKVAVGSYPIDVTNEEEVAKFAGWLKSHGGVDILVNCAGIVVNSPIENTSLEDFRSILDINVLGTFLMCKNLLPILRDSKAPSVINLCSAASRSEEKGQGAYSASKAALLSFTKSFALETYEEGIRVHAICPGAVATDMIGKARPGLSGVRMMSAEDIAEIAEFFLTHRTNAVVDEVIVHRVDRRPWPYCE